MPEDVPVLLFDVNETLLDLAPFIPVFTRMFGDAAAFREWFNQVALYSSAVTLANAYEDSSKIGSAVLAMMATIKHCTLRAEDLTEFKRVALSQPIYPDVLPALTALKRAGFRMVTLSNNSTKSTDDALRRNGIDGFFERTFSIDDHVHQYKPARESYGVVTQALALPPERFCLVSCHPFDILGAGAAGLQTAMILRPANAPIALGKPPDFVSDDLHAFTQALIARYVPTTPEAT
jgi:2-haloacid dehalogenase